MTCDPNALMALAARFQGSDPKMLQMAILQLLCEAAAGGGGGGGTIDVRANGSTVVGAATILNFYPGISVEDSGGGMASMDINLESGRVTLATDYDIPSSTYSNVGLNLNLPEGTFLVTVPLTMLVFQDVASNITAYVQLYNQTAGAPIANSEILIAAEFTPNAAWGGMATLTHIFTLNDPSTIRLQAREAFVDGGTVSLLGDNQCSMSYVKIAN